MFPSQKSLITSSSTIKPPDQRIVYKLSKPASMKFRLPRNPIPTTSPTLLTSLTKLLPFRQSRDSEQTTVENSLIKEGQNQEHLKFLFMLDVDSYLVGNVSHCDAFCFSMLEEYIQVDHLWTLRVKAEHMLVDHKHRTIVALTQNELQIYSYEHRRSKNAPILQKSFKITQPVKFMQFARDMLVAVFSERSVNFYSIDGASSRQICRKQYNLKQDKYVLYQAPQSLEGVINVFFTQELDKKGDEPMFKLHSLTIDLINNYEVGNINQIYEIKQAFRKTLKVGPVSKQCYLLNLDKKLMLFKKGYMVDEAKLNFHSPNTYLNYFPDKKVVFVAPNQIDMYSIVVNLQANPPKINLKSTDSIVINHQNPNMAFMDILRFQANKWAFFYQLPAAHSNGEVRYEFHMTIPWAFDQKINSLLPKVSEFKGQRTDENPQFVDFIDHIKRRCETVGKMGVSRREAYLYVWRQSGKQTIQQFKLLLDTYDYTTIKNEIQLKLKKKMMQWVEVHKMEQGCLNMLAEVLFSQQDFNEDTLKNYLTSHLLVRKLELFKEIKLYEKQVGKLRSTDLQAEKGKLMINIQEYTSTSQMDVKAYLLEMIYNLCKFKKDKVREIRMVLRKFRVGLRYGYIELLKQIVGNAREELLFLLKNVPEILPVKPCPKQGEDMQLLWGVWGELKEEQWDRVLYLGQVMTVFNRSLVLDFQNSIWIRRNFLSYHDLIYLTRAQIQQKFKTDLTKIFYYFLEQIFDKKIGIDSSKLQQIVNYLQDSYQDFPNHLYNNVFLYRQLYLYFFESGFITSSFQEFLRLKDDEMFKTIFDHEKFKKGSLLKQIKPIYQGLGQGEKFNYGLLKFFSSNLSQVSDIKYLLNRINNEKRQFHAQNEQMYEVLIKGMQIKLKLGCSDRDIPITEVLIYLEKIPLKEGNILESQMKVLKEINNFAEQFKKMRLNMSVFEVIRSKDTVLMKVIQHQIRSSKIGKGQNPQEIAKSSALYLEQLSKMKTSIYGAHKDNDLLFMYLVTLLQNISLASCVPILTTAPTLELPFSAANLESVVYYCYRRITIQEPKYANSTTSLLKLIELLPEDSPLREFIKNQVKLADAFIQAGLTDICFPICGQNGVISKKQVYNLMDGLSIGGLLGLDMKMIQKYVESIQAVVRDHGPVPITVYELYQKSISILLMKGLIKQTLAQIQILLELQPANPHTIIYITLVFRKLSGQLVEENRGYLITLIGKLFNKPSEILELIKQLVEKQASNDEQRTMLTDKIQGILPDPASTFDIANPLFDSQITEYITNHPQKLEYLEKLFKHQLTHLIKSNEQFTKSIDFPIFYTFLLHNPRLLMTYLHRARYFINIRQIRCFLSLISKYEEIFDPMYVLQYGKRVFRVLYEAERDGIDAKEVVEQVMSQSLGECDTVWVLPADNDNLNRLSKAVEKFKSKLKTCMSASAIKKRKSQENIPSKADQLDLLLSDLSLYGVQKSNQYPYPDSDGYIDKIQILEPMSYKQVKKEPSQFPFLKYLRWMLIRTDQPISHYLVFSNELEADEEVKRLENDLKTSFSKSPYDKIIEDNQKNIMKTFAHTMNMGKEEEKQRGNIIGEIFASSAGINLAAVSAIPMQQGSAISAGSGVEEWLEVVEESASASAILKEQIMDSLVVQNDGKLSFKTDLLRNYGKGHELDQVLPSTLKEIYEDEQIEYPKALQLIKQIASFSPKQAATNIPFLQVYSKIDQLQRKLSLDLPTRQLLPFHGLLLKQKDISSLFDYLKTLIQPYLNENNVHTLSRIISLAFKKPEFQQLINNEFIKAQVDEYVGLEPESMDEKWKLEKIGAFAQKMPLIQLRNQMEKMVEGIGAKDKRDRLVQVVVDILRQKNDPKGAQQFETRWLHPQ